MLILTGDIGGTKTDLRLVEVSSDEKSFITLGEQTYSSGTFTDLVPMVRQFIQTNQLPQPKLACFGIAGPVVNNSSHLTNLNWQLDSYRLEQELNINQVSLLNDFAANSYGVLGLKESDLSTIQMGLVNSAAPIAIIGAGTGLGQGFLVPRNPGFSVFATEGGHADFAPRNDLEFALLKYLQNKLNQEHISVERVVSGQGIVAIYQFLRDIHFDIESPDIANHINAWERQTEVIIDPGFIIAQGASQGDSLCLKTMAMFVEAYGAETGNLALKLLSYGGVYLAGGIAAKNLSLMKQGMFLNAFKDKGRMSPLLEKMPVHVVLNRKIGLLGCIYYALQVTKN